MNDSAEEKAPHITVCICTYKRPGFLTQTLGGLRDLVTEGRFSYSIVVVDNDHMQSAKGVVEEFKRSASIETLYCVESEQNIALARNHAVSKSTGEFVAFIDDDEFPQADWLLKSFTACLESKSDGVLGRVDPYFEQPPPKWLLRGRFCSRPEHPSGTELHWSQTRTGNALIRSCVFDGVKEPFRKQFGNGGEDDDFFKRMIGDGFVFSWCNESVVFEFVPPQRWTRSYLLKRALLRGQNQRFVANAASILKSAVAVPLYTALLPILLLAGHHRFMKFLIRIADHLGKLFGVLGWKPLGDKYLAS